MKYIFLFFLILNFNYSFGQNRDEIAANNASQLVQRYFKNSNEIDFLLYNIDEFYLIIKKEGTQFKEYQIDSNTAKIDSSIVSSKCNRMLKRVFEIQLSIKNFKYSVSDSLEKFGHYAFMHQRPQLNYFVLKKNGIKYIEYSIPPSLVENDHKKSWYPIEERLQNYLFGKYGRWLLNKFK